MSYLPRVPRALSLANLTQCSEGENSTAFPRRLSKLFQKLSMDGTTTACDGNGMLKISPIFFLHNFCRPVLTDFRRKFGKLFFILRGL